MSRSRVPLGSFTATWVGCLAAPATLQLGLSTMWPDGGRRESATVLFGGVLVAAALCVVTSFVLLARARRTNEAELAYAALFFLAVSVLPLVHGLTTPGVLYGENDATMSGALWSIPLGLAVGFPAVAGRTIVAERIDAVWRTWASLATVLIIALGASLLIWTSLLPAPDVGSWWTTLVSFLSFGGCVLLSHRHLELARIAGSRAPLVVAAGYGLVGSSAFVWLGAAPYSIGFWVAHLLDVTGVLLGTVGALVVVVRSNSSHRVLAPILVVDPRSALELGLEPAVHEFIRDLDAKDPITRDHVVRTAELAIATGERLGLDGDELRELGLAALLHDIGKLRIPDSILNKPGDLTADEYAIVKRHASYGADIVAASSVLASIAPVIIAHHERMDGRGYPKGLMGSQIPLHARIVAACDAFDAMANARQYRAGFGLERALAILDEHAGSQWDRRVVDNLVRAVRANPPTEAPERLDAVGRIGCDCLPGVDANAA